jgi:hypothetical protein
MIFEQMRAEKPQLRNLRRRRPADSMAANEVAT